jgi:polyvinyl alcohol dehydrogenase (cytochrome)
VIVQRYFSTARIALAAFAATVFVSALSAAPTTPDWTGRTADGAHLAAGEAIYRQTCAACHDSGFERAPQRWQMQDMTPEAILRALTSGPMRDQGAALSEGQRTGVAEYIAGRELGTHVPAAPNLCDSAHAAFDRSELPAFSGWGLDPAGTHAISPANAGINRRNLGRLKLKWAFGFPASQRVRSQPALAGGAIFIGNQNGSVYALDRQTGCQRWAFEAEAEVRNGIVVAPWTAGDRAARPLLFFGDAAGTVYAVEAFSGQLAWKKSADDHPAATITASPSLHDGTLYIPVSSNEEGSAASPGYVCCTFRGSVLALDAATGTEKWRTYTVDPAQQQGTAADGRPRLGPSGAAVWNAPVIDARRGQLYIATSDNYSPPASDKSDAIVAMDLASGRIRWHYQALAGDVWNVDCVTRTSGNCPAAAGPDYGFGAGTVLARGRNGRELVMAGQKSGWAFAVDPDTGAPVWKQRVGRGGVAAGIYFGIAAADGRLFVPVSDRPDGVVHDYPANPGLHALDIATGAFVWRAPSPDVCAGKAMCFPGIGGAISTTGQIVLAGGDDGHLRIHDAASGTMLWDFDTARPFETVNGVAAKGGAISGGMAPIAWQGQLIVGSGYGFASKMPGNVLLVFAVE